MAAISAASCRHASTRSAICPGFSVSPARPTSTCISAGLTDGVGLAAMGPAEVTLVVGVAAMRIGTIRNGLETLSSRLRRGKRDRGDNPTTAVTQMRGCSRLSPPLARGARRVVTRAVNQPALMLTPSRHDRPLPVWPAPFRHGRPLSVTAGPFPSWPDPSRPGRPLSVQAGPFPSWPAPFRHGRPLSVMAGPFPSWPAPFRHGRPLSVMAGLVPAIHDFVAHRAARSLHVTPGNTGRMGHPQCGPVSVPPEVGYTARR